MTFVIGYFGIFKITNRNIKLCLTRSFKDDDVTEITITPEFYEFESFENEIKRTFIEEGHITEDFYPFKIKPKFSTLDSIIEFSSIIIW